MRTHNTVDVFDINTRCWTKQLCTNDSNLPLTNIGGSCVLVRDRLYTFGGWDIGTHNRLYELDLDIYHWREVKPVSKINEPMMKHEHGLMSYWDNMLLIFRGYGCPNSPLQKGAQYEKRNEKE